MPWHQISPAFYFASSTSHTTQMNMVDLEKTDAFLARNMMLQGQQNQMAPQEQMQLQDEWGLYAIALIRQCVFEHTDAGGPDGKTYQLATMKVRVGGGEGGTKRGAKVCICASSSLDITARHCCTCRIACSVSNAKCDLAYNRFSSWK